MVICRRRRHDLVWTFMLWLVAQTVGGFELPWMAASSQMLIK
jgi:hypothetical protein